MVEKRGHLQIVTLPPAMKTCDHPGCSYNVFGKDKNTGKRYCKKHQYLRTDIKKKIRKKPLKERNWKLSRNKQGFDPFQWGFENEYEMFMDIWAKSDKKSKISGRGLEYFLGREQWVNCFAHILNKKNFPLYRYNPDNILLIHPYEHYLIDHGTVSERVEYFENFQEADFNVFYSLQEKLKEIYKKI